MEDKVLIHHGIQGQHWGRRNGPPYPLGYSAHTAEQKKKNPKGSLDNYGFGKKPKNTNPGIIAGGGGGSVDEEDKDKDELQEEKDKIRDELVKEALDSNPDYELPKDFGEFKAELREVGIDPEKYSEKQLKELHDETIATAASEKLYRELEKDVPRVKEHFGRSKEQHMNMEDLSDFKVSVMEFLGEELTDEQYRKAYSKYQKKQSDSYEKQSNRTAKLNREENYNIDKNVKKFADSERNEGNKLWKNTIEYERNSNPLIPEIKNTIKKQVDSKVNVDQRGVANLEKSYNRRTTNEALDKKYSSLSTGNSSYTYPKTEKIERIKQKQQRVSKDASRIKGEQSAKTLANQMTYLLNTGKGNIAKSIGSFDDFVREFKEGFEKGLIYGKNSKNINLREAYEQFKKDLKHSEENQNGLVLIHHGIDGQKWGHRNGPPYPLSRQHSKKRTKKDVVYEAKTLSDNELKQRTARLNLERQYIYANMDQAFDTRGYVSKLLEKSGKAFVDAAVLGSFTRAGRDMSTIIMDEISNSMKKSSKEKQDK